MHSNNKKMKMCVFQENEYETPLAWIIVKDLNKVSFKGENSR